MPSEDPRADDSEPVDAPIVGVVDEPIGAVDVPIVGVLDAPIAERVVSVASDDVVPAAGEPPAKPDPAVVPSEVSGGSVEAEGPTPSLAAKESKSVGPANPRVASKASNAGSDEAGATGVALRVGNVSESMPETPDVVVVAVPPTPGPELNVVAGPAAEN